MINETSQPKCAPSVAPASPCASSVRKDGAEITIRAICQADEPLLIKFHRGLSERSVYMRYFASLSLAARTAHARLARICFTESERETVLVAISDDRQSKEQQIVAVGRLNRLSDPTRAEVALLVLDDFQGMGLGTALLRLLVDAARHQKIAQIEAEMLRDNIAIQRVLRKLGFRLRFVDPRTVHATLSL